MEKIQACLERKVKYCQVREMRLKGALKDKLCELALAKN